MYAYLSIISFRRDNSNLALITLQCQILRGGTVGQHASLQTVGAGQYPGGQARHDFPDLHPQEIRPRGPGMAGNRQNTDQSLKTKI